MMRTMALLTLAFLTTGCISITPTQQPDASWDAPFEPTPLYGNPYLQCVEDRARIKFTLNDEGRIVIVPDLAENDNEFFCDEYEVKGAK